MNITKITIGRLYNLGSYEHVRYELTAEVGENESAAQTVVGLEKILAGLSPLKNAGIKSESELSHDLSRVEAMRTMPAVEWERNYGGHKGTPTEIIARYEESLAKDTAKREEAVARAARARELFDDLGGASKWKDAKLEWDNDEIY